MLELPHAPSAWADVWLVCPCCNDSGLHHEAVDIYQREHEDANTGIHVTVNGHAAIDTKMAGNPSRRRNGLVVEFSCETCTARPRLALIQHKGATFLHWLPGSEVGQNV